LLPRNCKILLLLPEVFSSEGGIPIIGQDLLTAIGKLKADAEPYPVVIANDRAGRREPQYDGHFKFTYCGSTVGSIRKARFFFSAATAIATYRPDLVICGHANHSPICCTMKSFFKVPYVVLTYGVEVWDIKSRSRRMGLERAALIAALSRYTRNRLLEQLDIAEDKVVIKPHSVRASFRPGPKPAHLVEKYSLEGKQVLMTVARLAKSEGYKGYDRVIEALAKVSRELPNVRYLLVGSGDDLPRIKGHAEAQGVVDKVIFAGYVPNRELRDYYNLCDLFVMPSKKEGLGIVFLEALACGKPVIAGGSDGSRDALLDGKLGILVDPDSVDQIAGAVVKVLKGCAPPDLLNPEYLTRTVQEHFGFDKYCERVEEMVRLGLQRGKTDRLAQPT